MLRFKREDAPHDAPSHEVPTRRVKVKSRYNEMGPEGDASTQIADYGAGCEMPRPRGDRRAMRFHFNSADIRQGESVR